MDSTNNNVTNFDRDRLVERGMDEFIGICKGILFDGVITEDEAVNLFNWLLNNPLVAEQWPASEVFLILQKVAKKQALSSELEQQLLAILTQLTGDPEVGKGANASSQLPLCNPAPPVFFEGAVFVLTGNMAMGSRKQVFELIESLGGTVVKKDVRLDTNFLVIGDIGSRAWMHSTHGRKIERAVELRDKKKTGIAIISEQHFMAAMP